VTAIVVAAAPVPGCLPGLAPLLDAHARARLQARLIERAAAWAAAAARGRAVLVLEGASGERLDATLPPGVEVVDAASRGDAVDGPLLLAGAAWPRLGPEHAAAAWSDLEAGAGAVFGPALDGGAYLVALARPDADLLTLPRGPAGLPRAIEAAQAHGHEVGLLRHERGLAGPDDAAAFLADPLLADDLRALLRGG
jgi:glycosyltransferase A (GT-A) superfamily protein (DUF2064 family)